MDLRDYLNVLTKRWRSVTAVTLAVLALVALATMLQTPRYTASTKLFFATTGGNSVTEVAQGSTFAEKQMASYAQVAKSPYVLQPVIDELGLDKSVSALAKSVSASVPPQTVILDVAVTDADPQLAATIANAIGAQMSKRAADLAPKRANGDDVVRVTVFSSAEPPGAPSQPKVWRNLAVGLLLGLLLGFGIALLRQLMDTRVRSAEDVATVTPSSVVGTIPITAERGVEIAMLGDPHSAQSEAYRRLRTNLQFLELVNGAKSVVVTSSLSGEGKSTTALNLAIALAEAGQKVLLVDADLRRPTISNRLKMEGSVGLTTVLIGRAEVQDVVQPFGSSGLDVLASGQIPPNPSELLGSTAMAEFIAQASETYDMVLFDSPPLLPVTDGTVLARLTGGALMVANANTVHKQQLRTALQTLETVDARVLGIVLNRAQHSRSQRYSYRYAGSYAPSTQSSLSASSPATPDEPRAGEAPDAAQGEQGGTDRVDADTATSTGAGARRAEKP